MPRKIDYSGQSFGRLIVRSEHGRDRFGAVMWLCACACGATTVVRGGFLKDGRVRSCGCGVGAGVSPYTLRHTSITHMMQLGVPIWEAAGLAGTSEAMVRAHYGHHHPDHMRSAVAALARAETGQTRRNAK